MTVSIWKRSPTPQQVHVDVAIVGGGVCGLSAALHFSRRGIRALVLEMHTPGSGASTRNAGFLMRGMAENYKSALDNLGHDTARNIWHWSEENLLGLKAEGVDKLPSFRPTPSCLLAFEQDEADALVESARLLSEDGFGALLVESGTDSAWASGLPLLGLVNPADATINPADLISLLVAKLGSIVVGDQEVHAIEAADGQWPCIVRTATLEVHCGSVLVCTNADAGRLYPSLAGVVRPNRGQMLALRAGGAHLDYAYYANHGHEYIRQTPDGTIVAGGCRKQHAEDERTSDDRTSEPVQRDIEAFARGILDQPIEIVARWAGTMGFSPDGVPLVGPITPEQSVWFCGGFTGHGMSLAYRTAAGVVSAMLDGIDSDPLISAFALSRVWAARGDSAPSKTS